jgi:TPP-dependent pyruvate/acetoin dehydrogenase alpha subunit
VRAGEGPAFIEAVTYRYKGHYGGDPEHTYRTREEVELWRGRDPLAKARGRLIADGTSESDLVAMERELKTRLQADQAWALEQRFLTVEEATDHVLIPLEVPGGTR